MNDIRIEVDLRHPASRVWLALTSPRLLSQWFAETEPAITAGVRFRMRPVDLPALDAQIAGDVLEFDEPRRLVMRWSAARRTVVAYDLSVTPSGCRLGLLEFPETGVWSAEERQRRESAYEQSLGRLPAVLDWLAFREVEFTLPVDPDPVTDPGSTWDSPPEGRTSRRRLAILGTFLLVPAVATTVVLASRDDPGPVRTAPTPSPSELDVATPPAATPAGRPPARATRPTPAATTASSQPSTTPGAAAAVHSPSSDPGQPEVTATYRTVTTRLLSGYTGQVVIANDGTATAQNWTVTIGLPNGASVFDVSGAEFQQDGREVRFTGPAVAAGTTMRFEFDVADARLGPKRPASCVIDDKPCAGL